MKVQHVLDAVWQIAPRELAEDWDNVGLLAGHPENPVTRVLCALDLTDRVVDEAIGYGAELIVTHHPILFRGRKNLREDDPEGAMLAKLIRHRISHIAMHTNFDNANPGVNDALAQTLGLTDIVSTGGYLRVGNIAPIPLRDWIAHTANALNAIVRPYGDPEKMISRVAVLGGSGGDYYREAIANGAQAFVTGEIGYHIAMNAVDEDLCILEAGHDSTERVSVAAIAEGLNRLLNADNDNVTITESTAHR